MTWGWWLFQQEHVAVNPKAETARLITRSVYRFSRNPIYVAFAIILIGEFFILPNWITLIYIAAATWLFHRQVLREEDYLRRHYGHAYVDYCNRVRRYL